MAIPPFARCLNDFSISWTRGIFSRRAEKLLVSTLNGEPLVSQIDRNIKRPTEANRPPAIFRLEKGGAQLLRSMGYEDAGQVS